MIQRTSARCTVVAALLAGLVSSAVHAAPADDAAMVAVQFVVSTPAGGPNDPEEIYCSLNVDGWPQPGRKLPKVAPGLYAESWKFAPKASLEYKFQRAGTWTSVEKGPAGEELPNRAAVIAAGGEQVVIHSVARWADVDPTTRLVIVSAPQAPPASTRTGDIRVHEHVKSPELGNERTVLVYLPPGYDAEPQARYPVLYMHDGQNVFDARTSFAGVEWSADEAAEKLIAAGKLPKLILVAICNTPQRIREYTPFPRLPSAGDGAPASSPAQLVGGGDGDKYLAFLIGTVKPLIDRTYRTRPDRASTAICGSSLGGLISLYAIAKHPDTFGAAAALSPSIWWADAKVLETVGQARFERPMRLWFDMGTAEGRAAAGADEPIASTRRLKELLESRDLKTERDFHYEEIDGGQHNEAAWAARFERVLLFLFSADAQPPPAPSK